MSSMEDVESLESKIDNAVQTEAVCLSLESLDLEDIPGEIFSSLASNRALKTLKLDYNDLTSLPEEIGLLKCLEELHLTGNRLESLPTSIGELCELKQLHLNENSIRELPNSFSKLYKLQVLNVVGNKLSNLEEGFGLGLSSLEELRADENCLENLPESFTCLKKLRVLELAENKITKLPDNFGDLKELRILNLSQNHVEKLPDSFSELGNLTSVDITNNHMEFLPDNFQSAEKLQYFYAVNNLYKVLPHWMEKLNSIVELNLSDNELNDMALPLNFGNVAGKNLVLLDLSGNKMSAIPDSIGQLTKLETFHLGSTICELERKAFQNGNWLPRLPESFGQLTSLTKLHLDENKLASLPDSFGDLKSLQWLDVSQNLIHELPKSFCNLTNLWYLQFTKNSLETLPEDFGNLTSLVELRLDSNSITTLPDSFAKLQNIQTVDLFHNKLTEIPKVLLKLKNLRRLDLDKNNLKIKEDKVPKLTTPVEYAPRDPALKGTWRGKKREDKQEQYCNVDKETQSITELIETAELEEKQDDDVEQEECNYSERVLELAMQRSLSMWRSHTGPETRDEAANTQRRSSQDKTFKFIPHEENPVPDIFEDATGENDSIDSSNESLADLQLVTDDWDREVEETWQKKAFMSKGLKTRKCDLPLREQLQDLLYSYPPAKQAFTKIATYDSIFNKCIPAFNENSSVSMAVDDVTGQFDDADD